MSKGQYDEVVEAGSEGELLTLPALPAPVGPSRRLVLLEGSWKELPTDGGSFHAAKSQNS